MSMSISGRMAAPILNTLRRNDKNLAKDMARVSGAQKIVGAADGASEYAISEKMRVQLRALDADVQNVKTGANMVSTALGGIQNIIDTLRSMKELAINAANDTNTDADRAVLEKEFSYRMQHIDDVAGSTNYNGKILLDGRYKPPLVRPERPTGQVHYVPPGDVVISEDGIYELDANYSGNIIIEAQNVELRRKDVYIPSLLDPLFDTYVYCSSAETNLWLNNLFIMNLAGDKIGTDEYGQDAIETMEKSTIRFHGTGNTINIVGDVEIYAYNAAHTAAVHVGEGLTVYDSGTDYSNAQGYFDGDVFMVEAGVTAREDYSTSGWPIWGNTAGGATLGTDYGEESDAYIVIDMGDYGCMNMITYGGGAAIGSGAEASIGSIRIESGSDIDGQSWMVDTDSENWSAGAGIGSGANGLVRGDIVINGGVVYPVTETGGAALGAGKNGTVQGNIIINDGYVQVLSDTDLLAEPQVICGAGIGTGSYNDGTTSYVGGIYINGGEISIDADNSEAIGRGCLYLNPEVISAGEVGEIVVNGGTYSDPFGSGSYHTYERERQDTDHAVAQPPETPLVIQYGTKAGQRMNVFIKAMDTASIGLKEADLSTREKAELAISLVDCAVNYVATEATTMGAYLQRLETTESNITLTHENTAAAESAIRDADMAREMVAFAKDSVLREAAQAMLANANQGLDRVLELLE